MGQRGIQNVAELLRAQLPSSGVVARCQRNEASQPRTVAGARTSRQFSRRPPLLAQAPQYNVDDIRQGVLLTLPDLVRIRSARKEPCPGSAGRA